MLINLVGASSEGAQDPKEEALLTKSPPGYTRTIMSLRWIHENLVPPNCDEECSDIDDSCSDDSYDSDLGPFGEVEGGAIDGPSVPGNNNNLPSLGARGGTSGRPDDDDDDEDAVDENGKAGHLDVDTAKSPLPCPAWDPRQLGPANGPAYHQSLKLKLFCRTGYFVGLVASGRAKGFPAESTNDVHVRLILRPASYGVVRLQSAQTGHYLAFNPTGHLYGEAKVNKDNTEWEQWNVGNYNAFRSHKYADAGWWLGVKRNGRHKPGPKTSWGQKAIQFLPMRLMG